MVPVSLGKPRAAEVLIRRLAMSFTSVCRQRVPLGALVVLGGVVALWSQPATRSVAAPVVGKSMRYCNPLPVPASSTDGGPQGVSLGDVTVVREGEFYYLFATGGGAWVSRDLDRKSTRLNSSHLGISYA